MHLFEAGILEKMTNAEYEKMLESGERPGGESDMDNGANQKSVMYLHRFNLAE